MDNGLVRVLSSGAGFAYYLMTAVGPAADGMTASSRRRLVACLGAGDPEGAAREMESHLRVLSFMRRVVARSGPGDVAVLDVDDTAAIR